MKASTEHDVAMETMRDGRPVSELQQQYEYRPLDWKSFFTRRKYGPWWIIIIITLASAILLTVYHDKIVEALKPFSVKVQQTPGGWLIPIIIFIIISFPPLFGHEIIALLCGVVYGLWPGFAVVAAGTFLGEAATWFGFQWVFRAKAVKLEKTNLNYGALARLTRDGGFWIVLLIRFSVMPSHFSTAVFATCGVNFWFFLIATFLTLPKQIIIVYIGVLLTATEEQKNSRLNNIILVITVTITLGAGVYIYRKMSQVKKLLIEEQATRILDYEIKQQAKISEHSHGEAEYYQPYARIGDAAKGHVEDVSVAVPIPAFRGQQPGRHHDDEQSSVKQQEFI